MLLRWPESMAANVTVGRGTTLQVLTELRDVFPTLLDAAGALSLVPDNYSMDGKSLLCLLQDPSGRKCGWREYLDLEHDICYNDTNHWNGLTDGVMKYVFNAYFPAEQLFNLTADPGERVDLASHPK